MAEKRLHPVASARMKLEEYRNKILKDKPSLSTAGDSVDRITTPSDKKDWQIIRYFNRINKGVKDEFRRNQFKYFATLPKGGERGKGYTVGQHWNKMLRRKIEEMKQNHLTRRDSAPSLPSQMIECGKHDMGKGEEQEEDDDVEVEIEILLFVEIFKMFEIRFFDSHFPLYGYMYSKTEDSPRVYLWQGEADAIGWYQDSDGKGRYVIVAWKVLDIVEFWTKNPDAYGKYLHQCLVYARLLQLHLELDYLPHILIVPIHGLSGQDIHPALFSDYPKRCKEVIESFEWSSTLPQPPQIIDGKRRPFNKLEKGNIDKNMLLRDLFVKDAKVGDLLEAFGWHSFKVI